MRLKLKRRTRREKDSGLVSSVRRRFPAAMHTFVCPCSHIILFLAPNTARPVVVVQVDLPLCIVHMSVIDVCHYHG